MTGVCPHCGHDLHLDTGPGMSLDQRDELLRVIVGLAPGESDRACCLFALDVIAGEQLHPHRVARECLQDLREAGVRLPTDLRQMYRVLRGQRSDGWRYV